MYEVNDKMFARITNCTFLGINVVKSRVPAFFNLGSDRVVMLLLCTLLPIHINTERGEAMDIGNVDL